MCTLALGWQLFDDVPIVVAANRDEANGRPAEPPLQYADKPRVIAPRDSRAGGTWIGYNAAGVFVGITNRWVDREGERSRGQLVADCLGTDSTSAAVEHVRTAVDGDSYAGFNLAIADQTRAVLVEWDGDLSVTNLDAGVHVIVNVGLNGQNFEPAGRVVVSRQQAANAKRLRSVLQPEPDETADEWLERAKRALGNHDYGVCIHGEGFGTRSATVISLETVDGELYDRYWFADGPPCRSPFRRVESSL